MCSYLKPTPYVTLELLNSGRIPVGVEPEGWLI
jgi:hypothetical protein